MEASRKIMKKFSIIHVPFLSFFSKELYIDVGLNWKGTGFAYLLLLLGLCWIPTIIKIYVSASDFVDNEAPALVEQVPEITIVDGEVSIKEPQPYYITSPDSNDVLVIIDTTGTINSLEETDALCLLTKTSVIYRQSKFETRTVKLSEVKYLFVDSKRITGWLQTLKKVIVIAMYPFALVGSYVYRIIQALIYAAIGLLFASLCKVTLSYDALLRLAIVAVTPCIIASTVLVLAGVGVPGLLYLLVALGYLFFGVKVISQTPTVWEEGEVPEGNGDLGTPF
ncbi:MAG: DUF1189 family protein [Planctomycetota bacterium]|jgi:hypothetical protein